MSDYSKGEVKRVRLLQFHLLLLSLFLKSSKSLTRRMPTKEGERFSRLLVERIVEFVTSKYFISSGYLSM